MSLPLPIVLVSTSTIEGETAAAAAAAGDSGVPDEESVEKVKEEAAAAALPVVPWMIVRLLVTGTFSPDGGDGIEWTARF